MRDQGTAERKYLTSPGEVITGKLTKEVTSELSVERRG